MSVFLYQKPSILSEIPKDRHAVIEASAGTGKTYTLEHLVVELVLSGVPIQEILVVTFTKPATAELIARIRGLLIKLLELREDEAEPGASQDECWELDDQARARIEGALRSFDSATIATIHSFCQGILGEHAFANQRLFDEELIDSDEAFAQAFLQAIREEIAVSPHHRALLERWLEEKALEDLQKLLGACIKVRGRLLPVWEEEEIGEDEASIERMLAAIGVEISLEAMVVHQFLPLVRGRLRRHKREAGVYDYEDMLELVRDSLLGEHGGALVSELRCRYSHALIDEFQDTDELQWEIFRKIFFESERKDADGRKQNLLYLIGDPKQAIYRFRGADVETYLAAREELLQAGGARVVLDKNFRSTGALIDAYNDVMLQGAESGFFTHPEIDYREPVGCGDPALELLGRDGEPAAPIHVFEAKLPKGKRGGSQRSQEVVLPPLARAIAAQIRAITDPAQPSLRMKDGRGVHRIAHREIYVLCSSNSEARKIGEVLREEGVPIAFLKQDGLLQTDEAQDLLEVLAAIADPADDSKRLKAWLTPFFGLTLTSIEAARELPPSHPLVQRLYDWKAVADARNFAALFSRLFDESGVVRRLILTERGERALTNYLHLSELLLEAQGEGGRSLQELLALLARWIDGSLPVEGQEANQQRLESDRDAVQIMTMHASKGLEAKVVFLAGGLSSSNRHLTRTFHKGRERITYVWTAPSRLKGKSAQALKEQVETIGELAAREERWEAERLLYVALTRAKGRLYLPWLTSEEEDPSLSGPYRVVDERLRVLCQPGQEQPPYLQREVVDCTVSVERDPALQPGALVGWEPRFESDDRGAELGALREERRGYRITSYTQMRSGGSATLEFEPEREDFVGEAQRASFVTEEELPGGAGTGIFLHEVLAKVPTELALRAGDAAAFAKDPEVLSIVEREARAAGFDERYLRAAAELVFTSLRAGLPLRDGAPLGGIAAAPKLLREMEFLYPIPERSHPRLEERLDGSPLEIRRGFVKGFVDLLFEHEGLAYLGDWKSDVLPSYSPEAIGRRVEESYRLQAKLYSLALVKLLEIRDEGSYEERFGGFLFLFLRGMQLGGEPGGGIYFERPSWVELLSWEEELLERKEGAA